MDVCSDLDIPMPSLFQLEGVTVAVLVKWKDQLAEYLVTEEVAVSRVIQNPLT